MSGISVTIKDKTPELLQKMDAAIGRFVVKGAAYVKGQLKASMLEAKSGRTYGKHQASAPGESPANDSSNLSGSIEVVMASSLEAKIGTPVEYAPYLETGTHARSTRSDKAKKAVMGPHMGGMAARPLWEVTANDSLPTLENILRAEIQTGR